MADKKPRGFAAMDVEKQRQIASKGGKAAHAKGTAHQFTPEEARAAGRKGGQSAHAKGTAHEFTSDEARAAGRKGGQSMHDGQGLRHARPEQMPNETFPAENASPDAFSQDLEHHSMQPSQAQAEWIQQPV